MPIVGKCILCAERVGADEVTACAAVCPTGATLFGDRVALLDEAHARIAGEPRSYVDHVYGEHEAGGTSVLLLAGVPFESLGLQTNMPRQSLPMLTWDILEEIPDFVVIAGAFLFGLHWITERRNEVQAANRSSRAKPPGAPGMHPDDTSPAATRPVWRRLRDRLFGDRGRA